MRREFKVTLAKDGSFVLPIDVRALYGEARPAVMMTVRGKRYRTRVMVYGGKFMLALRKAQLAECRLFGGEPIDVVVEPDVAPRTVAPPKELAAAMKKSAAARAGWDVMSFTHKREWAEAIAGAKKPETRDKRVANAIAALVEKAKKAAKKK